MHNSRAICTKFKLACLEFLNRRRQIGGNRSGFGIRHQTPWTKNTAQLGHLRHHVWRGNEKVEIHFALGDGLNKVLITRKLSAGGLGLSHFFTAGNHRDTNCLSRSLRKSDSCTQLLVGVLGIDTKAHMRLHGFVEFGCGVLLDQLNGFKRLVGTVLDFGNEAGQAFGKFWHDRCGVQAALRPPPKSVNGTNNERWAFSR